MITRLSAGLAAGVLLVGLATGAPAASADDAAPATVSAVACGDQLALLRNDLLVLPITGGKVDKERAGLLKLVDDAAGLVAADKAPDAIVKLENLQTKLGELASSGRISAESATLLLASSEAATQCLSLA